MAPKPLSELGELKSKTLLYQDHLEAIVWANEGTAKQFLSKMHRPIYYDFVFGLVKREKLELENFAADKMRVQCFNNASDSSFVSTFYTRF